MKLPFTLRRQEKWRVSVFAVHVWLEERQMKSEVLIVVLVVLGSRALGSTRSRVWDLYVS
jgi:hypothetical protein